MDIKKDPKPNNVSDFIAETEDFKIKCITHTPQEETMPPVLIDNLLHYGHNMLLYGPSKSYKSFLLIMLCLAIATGGEWMGNRCSQGNVLLIEFENGEIFTYERIKSIMKENNLDESCLSHISILTVKNNLDLDKLFEFLIKNIPCGLYSAIVIDPLYKFFDGAESQAEVVDGVLSKIDFFSKKAATSVILCHHTKKENQNYQSMIDKISGSSIIGRNIPSLICISAVYEKDGYNRELIRTKLRHFPQQPPFYIDISGGSYSLVNKNDTDKSDSSSVSAKKPKDNSSDKSKELIRFYKFLKNTNETVKISQLEELMDVSKNTIKSYIDNTHGFERDNKGVVTYTVTEK